MAFDIVVTNSGNLLSGQVGPRHLSPVSVWSGHVGSGSVGGGLGTRSIASGTVGPLDLGSGSILSGAFGSGVISRFAVASGSFLGFELGSGAIVSGRLASGQVGTGHYADNSVQSGAIGSGQVASGHLASGLLANITATILSGGIASGQIASGAVQGFFGATRHLASGTVGSMDFGSGAVIAGTVGSGAIQSGNVASGVIGNIAISSGSVTSGRIGATGSPVSGNFLQADFTWLNPQGGVWKRLATATASDSATIAFTGLTSAYVAYKVVLSHILPATDTANFFFRTSTNGGAGYDAGASDYEWEIFNFTSAASAVLGDTADSEIQLNRNTLSSTANETFSGELTIYNPSAAKYGQVTWFARETTAAGGFESLIGGGQRLAAADVDAIQFLMSTGNIAGGQFDLFGLSA